MFGFGSKNKKEEYERQKQLHMERIKKIEEEAEKERYIIYYINNMRLIYVIIINKISMKY